MLSRLVRGADVLRHVGPMQVPEAGLVGALWWYAGSVLYPARVLKRAGARIMGPPVGDPPEGLPLPGAGLYFTENEAEPIMLDGGIPHYELVEDFDRLAQLYEILVRPFSTPIFDEALQVIRKYVATDSRVLDLGCGPGREVRRVAALVPEGEVIGADLAAGMVEIAHTAAHTRGLRNCTFFQADAADLPRDFTDRFDLVYSCLSHHHFPEPEAVAANVLRCLRAGGVYCVIDPGPAWFNALSTPLGCLADPGWIGWKTPEEFRSLLDGAGFTRHCWIPLLPGFGLAVGQKAFTPGLAL
jgi:ubiquinone/menaquinone biosynthesis C-methylase UbiE